LPNGLWVNSGTSFSWVSPVSGGTTQFVETASSGSSPITTAGTYTATYGVQYEVTFTQTGITSAAGTNTVLTVGSTNYAYNALPNNLWVNSGTTFTWASPVSGGTTQFALTGSSGLANPIAASGTDTATYQTQYKVTFTQSSVNSSAGSNTVLTLGSTNYTYNALPANLWVNSGTSFTWASPVSGGSNLQFALTSSSGLANPIAASGTDTATYQAQAIAALDGYNSTNTVTSQTMTITLTTTKSNDVLYLSFVGESNTGVSSISSTGGTSAWKYRAGVETTDSASQLSTWYATWTSSGKTTITINLNGTGTHVAVIVFGISGANTTSPFDGNAVTNKNDSGTASASITTSTSNDLIIGALGVETTSAPANGSGFNSIANQAAPSTRETSDEYSIASGPGTYTPSYTFNSNYWGIIVDAIKPL
jgi:hypothetical protein